MLTELDPRPTRRPAGSLTTPMSGTSAARLAQSSGRHCAAPQLEDAAAHPARHHRARPDRHGRRQRRRRVRHLHPGRPELRQRRLLWTLLLLVPVLYVNQEMVLRLGAVTGVGHARLILERFGKFWGAFSVIDLFLLNALTIVTEFIGISLGMDYLGHAEALACSLRPWPSFSAVTTGCFRRFDASACSSWPVACCSFRSSDGPPAGDRWSATSCSGRSCMGGSDQQ